MSAGVNVRAQAARCVTAVIGEHESLTTALELSRSVVAPRDIGLLYEISFGVMRHYYQLYALARLLLSKNLKPRDKDVLALILVGLYQLIYMRIPNHAALNETVSGTKSLNKPWARGLVNALLRRYLRESEDLLQKISAKPEVDAEMPEWLAQRVKKAWPDDWPQIREASQSHPPMTLRVNRACVNRDDYLELLKSEDLWAEAIESTPAGLQLEVPVNVDKLPGFEQGKVSVQDAAAQLASELLAPVAGDRVLDACAAPGGKTAALLEHAAANGDKLNVVAWDNSEQRLERLTDGLARLSLEAEVACVDVSDASEMNSVEAFDRILLDAPCSATGVIRRHPDIKLLRRETDIVTLAKTQAKMLDVLWSILKPGGQLLYATCSILPDENAQQIESFLARQADASEVIIEANWGAAQKHGRQILPGQQGMDGFYYALLEKAP
ncbi:MAG: 16S rRNA (cytosine(967)-C(5))-methyltransferase RsmB [Sulfuriflexus sp.]|nr:16S rRNA (cytosine(967)-C(5))-methyltransferase RsmB [Sulfuriflexus sp.]